MCSPMSWSSAPNSKQVPLGRARVRGSPGLRRTAGPRAPRPGGRAAGASSTAGTAPGPTSAAGPAGRRGAPRGRGPPMASSTIPSRNAQSLTVSSSRPVASIRYSSTAIPAGRWSTRRGSAPGSLPRCGGGQGVHAVAQRLELGPPHGELVDRLVDDAVAARRRHAGERHEGPRRADQLAGPQRQDLPEHRLDRPGDPGAQPLQVLVARGVVRHQLGGQAPDAEVDARREGELGAVADGELEAPAAEISGQGGTRVDDHARADRPEDELRLARAVDDGDPHAGLDADPVDEQVPVERFADRRGADGDDLVGPVRLGDRLEAGDHRDRLVGRPSADDAVAPRPSRRGGASPAPARGGRSCRRGAPRRRSCGTSCCRGRGRRSAPGG